MKYAIIDIGSNSVRLMLWAGGTLYKWVITTRLAQGLSESGAICEEAAQRTVDAVREFCEEGTRLDARVYAFATAAVRNASNGAHFCELVKNTCGIQVDVVSGEEEAQLGLYGALGRSDGTIIDIGGASTEVCMRKEGKICFSTSLDVGVVRLLDRCGQDEDKLKAYIRKMIERLDNLSCVQPVYVIGGTASTLASVKLGLEKYDAAKLNGLMLSSNYLDETAKKLLCMSVEQRKALAGMEPRRADLIAGGAVLLSEMVHALKLNEAYFSDSDNLEGYLVVRGLV